MGTKPLYVALAQRKEERRAQLSTQFMQRVGPLRYTSGIPQQAQQQGGYSFQPGQPGFYIPTMPQGQRAFITQPVNQMTRPRWQSSVRPMGGAGYQQLGQMSHTRPTARAPTNVARRDAPYQQAMGARNMPNQVMRPVVPAPQPQRAAYKLNANTRDQYPAVIQQQQQPDAAAAGLPSG